jgi:hypothetical protein
MDHWWTHMGKVKLGGKSFPLPFFHHKLPAYSRIFTTSIQAEMDWD